MAIVLRGLGRDNDSLTPLVTSGLGSDPQSAGNDVSLSETLSTSTSEI